MISTTPEVEKAALRAEQETGEKVPQDPSARYERIEELGLELCPAETGPELRLKYMNQPMGEWLRIGMKQISVRSGDPRVFSLARDGGWLVAVQLLDESGRRVAPVRRVHLPSPPQ